MAPHVPALLAAVCACCLSAAGASSGGLRGGMSDLPPEARVDESSVESQVDEEAAAFSVDSNNDYGAMEDNETLGAILDNETFEGLGEILASAQWGHRNVKVLYHTTSPSVANSILHSSFHPGHGGWCGGAIYFVDTPYLPRSKYGPATKSGAVIQAVVDMGRMANMDRHCRAHFGSGIGGARHAGFDSLRFNPGDGNEYVISSSSRILSMRRYK